MSYNKLKAVDRSGELPHNKLEWRNMDTQYTIPEIIQKVSTLFERPDIQLVVLFGSYASGAVHRRSDIDLGVLADKLIDTIEETADLIRMLHVNDIDLVDLRRVNPLLAREIIRRAIVLYERDPGIFSQFVSLTIRRYVDTHKLREAQQRVVDQFLQARGIQ